MSKKRNTKGFNQISSCRKIGKVLLLKIASEVTGKYIIREMTSVAFIIFLKFP